LVYTLKLRLHHWTSVQPLKVKASGEWMLLNAEVGPLPDTGMHSGEAFSQTKGYRVTGQTAHPDQIVAKQGSCCLK
jgi:hypothetical protein